MPPVIEVNGELKPIDSPTRLPQLQSSQPQQRLASPSAPASLGAEVGFDLSRPLEYCNQVLSQLRAAQNRPEDLAAMTPAQLKEEKVLVKRLLRQFDATFKEKHGKLVRSHPKTRVDDFRASVSTDSEPRLQPSKPQKEPLRPLYMRYRELTKLVGDPADDDNLSGTTTTTTTDQPARSDSPKPTPVPAPASPKVLSTSGGTSALAHGYRYCAFDTLANPVRVHGARWRRSSARVADTREQGIQGDEAREEKAPASIASVPERIHCSTWTQGPISRGSVAGSKRIRALQSTLFACPNKQRLLFRTTLTFFTLCGVPCAGAKGLVGCNGAASTTRAVDRTHTYPLAMVSTHSYRILSYRIVSYRIVSFVYRSAWIVVHFHTARTHTPRAYRAHYARSFTLPPICFGITLPPTHPPHSPYLSHRMYHLRLARHRRLVVVLLLPHQCLPSRTITPAHIHSHTNPRSYLICLDESK